MDGISLPNGVVLSFAKSDVPFDPELAEIDHWVAAVRTRGLKLSSVPEEYRARVHRLLCDRLVAELDVPQNHTPPAAVPAKE